MRRKIQLLIFLLHFLFYISIGPAKALHYFLFAPQDTSILIQLKYFSKIRVNKKYFQQTKVGILSKIKSGNETTHNYASLPSYCLSAKYISRPFIRELIYKNSFRFSSVRFHILHCSLRV